MIRSLRNWYPIWFSSYSWNFQEQQQQKNAQKGHQPLVTKINSSKKTKTTNIFGDEKNSSLNFQIAFAGFIHFGHWYRKIIGCLGLGTGSGWNRFAKHRWESLLTGGEDLNWGAFAVWQLGGGDHGMGVFFWLKEYAKTSWSFKILEDIHTHIVCIINTWYTCTY